jgi:hypothetical protein
MNLQKAVDVHRDPAKNFAFLPEELTVYCPIGLKNHVCDEQMIDERAVSWCLEHGLCEQDSPATRMGRVVGVASGLRFAPDAAVEALTKYVYWQSLLGDVWDSYPDDGLPRIVAHVGELQRVMYLSPHAPLPTSGRWAASLRELRSQIEQVLHEDGLAAFQREHAAWLNGQLWYTTLRQRVAPPEVGEYLRMLWVKSGFGTLIAFTGASLGYHLKPRQLAEPLLRAFTEAVMLACALLNDLLSITEEAFTGATTTNLYAVLAHTDGVDAAAALARGLQLYERIVVLVTQLQQQLLADPRRDIVGFAADLPNWIPAGIQLLSTRAGCLHSDQGDGQDIERVTTPRLIVSDTPTVWDPDGHFPPPYPEISWWWGKLKDPSEFR